MSTRLCCVPSWREFERLAPELADVVARHWPGIVALDRGEEVPTGVSCFAIAYLATLRSDGAPRLHPFCPILASGRLFAAIPQSSPKGQDLRRDPRCVIHAQPGPDDDELCIRARAREVTADTKTKALVEAVVVASGVGGMIESVSEDLHLRVRVRSGRCGQMGERRTGRHVRRSSSMAGWVIFDRKPSVVRPSLTGACAPTPGRTGRTRQSCWDRKRGPARRHRVDRAPARRPSPAREFVVAMLRMRSALIVRRLCPGGRQSIRASTAMSSKPALRYSSLSRRPTCGSAPLRPKTTGKSSLNRSYAASGG